MERETAENQKKFGEKVKGGENPGVPSLGRGGGGGKRGGGEKVLG